jgi:hypothetical protein
MIEEHVMKHQRTKRVTKRKSSKTAGKPGRRNIAKAVRGTGIASKHMNRENRLATGVAGMTEMGTESGRRRETLAGWGDDTI